MRTLILVYARNAEEFIGALLKEIVKAFRSEPGLEILIIDDASKDQTTSQIRNLASQSGDGAFHMIRNPYPYGVGGCQKIGFRHAVEGNFDAVLPILANRRYKTNLARRLYDRMAGDPSCDVLVGFQTRARGIGWIRYLAELPFQTLLRFVFKSLTHFSLHGWHGLY